MAKKTKKPKTVNVEIGNLDQTRGELKAIGGSNFDPLNNRLANQAISALWMPPSMSGDSRDEIANATIAALIGIAPRDEAEGMLAAQMVSVHNSAMECFRRAMIEGQTFEGREQNLRFADRLSKTYAHQLDALKRYRRKADQTVRIERVVVKDGGQAIVGNVTRGGGDGERNDDQPHAPAITDESGAEVWGEDTLREPVPVAGRSR